MYSYATNKHDYVFTDVYMNVGKCNKCIPMQPINMDMSLLMLIGM